MNFSNTLIYWYLQTKRDLPWRKTRDPYLVWLSEIILQQTRVSQGMSYYLTFSTVFPTVEDLANAEESKVLKMWQGLGYYSRARNLHFTAKYVSNELSGKFPTSYKELIKLKGIGDYTASAISSTEVTTLWPLPPPPPTCLRRMCLPGFSSQIDSTCRTVSCCNSSIVNRSIGFTFEACKMVTA